MMFKIMGLTALFVIFTGLELVGLLPNHTIAWFMFASSGACLILQAYSTYVDHKIHKQLASSHDTRQRT